MAILRRITDFILKGRVQAMGAAFICAFIPLLWTVSVVIAAFVTLRKGIQEGALVAVAASLPLLAMGSLLAPPDIQTSYAITALDLMVMVVAITVMAWLFAIILRMTASWSTVLQAVIVIGIVTVVLVHLIFPDVQVWWQHWLTNYFTTVEQSVKSEDDASRIKFIGQMVTQLKPFATGIVTMVFAMYALLIVLIARWWQDAIYNPGGLRKELMVIRINRVLGVVFIVGVLLTLIWDNATVRDVMPVLYLVFGLAGLSLLHYVTAARHMKWIWLVLIYAVLTFVPQTVLLVALMALLDTFSDFRHRIKVVPANF
jgi:hypothetical protein